MCCPYVFIRKVGSGPILKCAYFFSLSSLDSCAILLWRGTNLSRLLNRLFSAHLSGYTAVDHRVLETLDGSPFLHLCIL